MRRSGLLLAIAVAMVLSIAGSATAAPLYDVKATWGDTNLPPGGEGQFVVQIRNVGAEDGDGAMSLIVDLPTGVTATHVAWPLGTNFELNQEYDLCEDIGTGTVQCEFTEFLVEEFNGPGLAQAPSTKATNGLGGISSAGGLQPTGYLPTLYIDVEIAANASGIGTNTVTLSGGGATGAVSDVDQVTFGSTPAPFGLVPGTFMADLFDAAYPFGSPERQAGTHPSELRVNFDLNAKGPQVARDGTHFIASRGTPRTVEVTMPRGFIGNPEATPKCDPVDFSRTGSTLDSTGCPSDTQVGYLNVAMTTPGDGAIYGSSPYLIPNELLAHVPIYNLEPPRGQAADFGFNAAGFVQAHIYPTPDSAQEYAIKTVTPNISSLVSVRGSEVVVWGVPGDPAHDRFRYYPAEQENGDVAGAPFSAAIRPLLTTPMDCGFDNGGARFRADSYSDPGNFTPVEESGDPLNVEGCEDLRFRFEPDISLQPTSRAAGGPTGLDVSLKVPQRNDEVADADELYADNGFVKGISTPPIKKAVVTLPEGMTISPSAAQGLATCSSAQIGLGTDSPVTCPDASQYGKLLIRTPILPIDAQPEGHIYVATQGDNPFGNFISLYLVIQEPDRGILIKVPGRVDLDPRTGQITTTFDDLPQFPVSEMQMSLKGGVRAALVNPSTCGIKTITAEFFSWHDPTTPHRVNNSYVVTQKADGSPCVNRLDERPFGPALEAGTVNNTAGTYSPLIFRLTRGDDDQEFAQLGVTLTEGLIGKLAGVGRCSDTEIAQAISRDGAGQGSQELSNPSCPASSLIGVTDVGAGVGVPLTYVPGKVYLAGPYRGMPLSIVVITPAVVGPFDLGVIAVRTGLRVDPETTRVSAISDPFPQVFQGIPVRIRDIRLNLDRDRFILNPTSCAEKQISARVTGTGGDVFSTADDTAANLVERFQAADCGALPFKPRLSFRLFGKTSRGGHPRLRAVVRGRPGDANIAGASVALPRSEFLEQGHIKTVCTRVQFAAKQCPRGSVYGHVTAKTPLFDEPFSGPVYLRSSSNPLPDLVAVLRGPASLPIEVEVAGRVDSINGGIRNTFEVVPDAPVTSFVLTMQGGAKGLLVNSTNLCAGTRRAVAKFRGQNGKRITLRPEMKASCGKQARKKPTKR